MSPKFLFQTAVAVVASIATPVFAADMAVKVPPPARMPVAATSWTGCYINGGAGYGFFKQVQNTVSPGESDADETTGGSGWVGTVGGGCDYQFSPGNGWGNWVVGALVDYDFMNLRGQLGAVEGNVVGTEKESSAVAVGARIGYLVTPQILTYVNGGWSSTRFDGVSTHPAFTGPADGDTLPGHSFSGGFIGGGTEIAVASVPGLYWRNEYRLATYRGADLPLGGPDAGAVSHESKSVQTITTSLVWKFNATQASAIDAEGKPPRASAMATKAAPRTPVLMAATWTGCYINGGAGYGFFKQDQHIFGIISKKSDADETTGGSGWLGTVGGGCDYQFSPGNGWGNWVVGALVDYDLMDLRGQLGAVEGNVVGTEKESSAVAVGARIGYLVTPQILTYVNGGWSSTRLDDVSTHRAFPAAVDGDTLPGHSFSGGFIGGGTEIAVASVPGLYWRNEYRLATYRGADLPLGGPHAGIFINHESMSVQTITTSLVFKFH